VASAIAIPYSSEAAFTEALNSVIAHWAKSTKAQKREEERARRESEKRLKAAVAESKRAKAKATIVGSGVLYREIAAAVANAACSIKDLTVLAASNDPYRLDTTIGHQIGEWLAHQIKRLVGTDGRVHLRGLFYRIVAAGGVEKPDGTVFTNTFDNWLWLMRAAKAARWLGYVPFDRIPDERNEAPRLFLPDNPPASGDGSFVCGGGVELPMLSTLLVRGRRQRLRRPRHLHRHAGKAELSRQKCLGIGPAIWRAQCRSRSDGVRRRAGTAECHPGVLRRLMSFDRPLPSAYRCLSPNSAARPYSAIAVQGKASPIPLGEPVMPRWLGRAPAYSGKTPAGEGWAEIGEDQRHHPMMRQIQNNAPAYCQPLNGMGEGV
jgi:hypothetical protein